MTAWVADRSLRIDRNRCTVLGGSPLKLLRVTPAGLEVIDRLIRTSGSGAPGRHDATGSPVTPGNGAAAGNQLARASGAAASHLLDRLIDAGMIHPLPEPGSAGLSAAAVTLVVPVKDDQVRLDALLARISSTTPGIAGVIVVDDGSRTALRIPALSDTTPVRLLRRTSSGGPGVARMAGLTAVTTPLVAFLDVDCSPVTGWLDLLLGHFSDERVVVVAPRVSAAASTQAPGRVGGCLVDHDERHSPLDLGAEPARVAPGTRVSYVPSAALVARTAAIRDSRGFDPALRFGEDVDLIWRLVAAGGRVRYEPRAVVHHEVRPGLGGWLRQRFDYGTSAAPLARRHHDAVAPAAMSRWSLTVWLLVAAGHRRAALALAALSALLFVRKVPGSSATDVGRIVVLGHLGAGRQLANTLVRVWWPLALVAAVVSKRARRVVTAAVLWQIIDHRPSDAAGVLLGLADDMAYGAGVWAGCLRERSFEALRPRLS